MKWLLWGQVALVLASVGVAVTAMTTSRYGMGVSLTLGALPLLLILSAVMALVALKRRKSFVPAGIVLLLPAVWLAVTSIPGDYGSSVVPSAGVVVVGDLASDYDALSSMRTEMQNALAWLNWFWWLNLAAAALAVVTALLLFRHSRTRRVRPSGVPPE